jgi:single-stranded-DNA-specific exonuclease
MEWKWLPRLDISDELARGVGGDRLVAERLVRLGGEVVTDWQTFLDPGAARPPSPFELPGLVLAVESLRRIKGTRGPLLLWGAEDVDGLAATSLLLLGLRAVAIPVEVVIPVATREGRARAFARLRDWGRERRGGIVTCGAGGMQREVSIEASRAGLDLVRVAPSDVNSSIEWGGPEDAVGVLLTTSQLPEGHPMRGMPVSALAYHLWRGLLASDPGTGLEGGDLDELLDLVALGVAAADANLRGETRRLLWRGIRAMQRTERVGFRALSETMGLALGGLDEVDLRYRLGSRLSAQAQLGDPAECIELLTTQDAVRAAELAAQCEGLHARRRQERQLIEASATALLEKDPTLLGYAAIVLAHPDWGSRTVGVVADRLAERYSRPVVLLGGRDVVLSGWARSGPEADVERLLRGCASLLLRFGGGARAASLSLHRDNLFAFRRALSQAVRERVGEPLAEEGTIPFDVPHLPIDGEVDFSKITPALVSDLTRLAPFGRGNRRFVLASRRLRLVRQRQLGARGQSFELLFEAEDGTRRKAISWQGEPLPVPPSGELEIAYHLRFHSREGSDEPLLELLDLRSVLDAGGGALAGPSSPGAEAPPAIIVDCRTHPAPRTERDRLLALYPEAVVWREGEPSKDEEPGATRIALSPAETLLVWTIPPGPEEWEAALEKVAPRRLLLFAEAPPDLSVTKFLQRLGGLINFALRTREGRTSLVELAAAMAHREATIRQGLRWFAGRGQIGLEVGANGNISLSRSARAVGKTSPLAEPPPDDDPVLGHLLAETTAWRRNWRRLIFDHSRDYDTSPGEEPTD